MRAGDWSEIVAELSPNQVFSGKLRSLPIDTLCPIATEASVTRFTEGLSPAPGFWPLRLAKMPSEVLYG